METTSKETVIKKINKYGKIGKIITIVMLVILGFSLVATLASAILLKNISDDLIDIKVGTQAEVTLNPSAVDPTVDDKKLETLVNAVNENKAEAGLNLGAVSLSFDSAKVVDGKVVCETNEAKGSVSLDKISNILLICVIAFVLSIVSITFAMLLCKAIEKCESPFEDAVINKMRLFAFSLLPWAIFSSVPDYAMNNIFQNNVKINFSLDFNIIFAVLIILALTAVFKYGAYLQKESDETL